MRHDRIYLQLFNAIFDTQLEIWFLTHVLRVEIVRLSVYYQTNLFCRVLLSNEALYYSILYHQRRAKLIKWFLFILFLFFFLLDIRYLSNAKIWLKVKQLMKQPFTALQGVILYKLEQSVGLAGTCKQSHENRLSTRLRFIQRKD